MAPLVNIDDLKKRLAPLLEKHDDAAVVFDADGTLWSHDVGCMVYDEAVSLGVFRPEAQAPLRVEALRLGLDVHERATANEIALALQTAWYSRTYDERSAAEMQVWAYVGFTESDFRALVRDALSKGRHEDTLHDHVLHLADWVRQNGHRSCVVSASPSWVVEEATVRLGFSASDIAAGVPNTSVEGETLIIQAGMATPLPYGPDKVVAGRALLGPSRWLAALGDSDFDLHMMAEADIGVAIGEKATMLEGLSALSHCLRLTFG